MSKRHENLVRELAELYGKYSAVEIRAAIEDISSGRAFADFVTLASRAADKTPTLRPKLPRASKKPKASIRELLDRDIAEMRKIGDDAGLKVARVLEDGRDGKILRTSSAIMQLLAPLGVEVSRGGDRLSLLRSLGQQLLGLDEKQREAAIEAADDTTGKSSSLERWTSIIVRGDRGG